MEELDYAWDLFVHRSDVFAQQQPSGAYFPQHRELTKDDLDEHLSGFASYGCYQIHPADNTVKYVVWDLDIMDEEARDTLCRLVEEMTTLALAEAGDTTSWASSCAHPYLLLEFSGGKGYHIWLFLSEPVPAEKIRRWVASDFTPAWREIAEVKGWPAAELEIFPKQDTISASGYGNLVKLPLGVHAVTGAYSEIMWREEWPQELEDIEPFNVHSIPDRAPVTPVTLRSRGEGHVGPHSPFACVDHIRNSGVGQGVRDRAMFHLALYYYGHGIDKDLALELCHRANEHFDPPLSEGEVVSKIESAYRGTYESARCGTDWLASLCPGPCNVGWHVLQPAEPEVSALLKAATGGAIEVEVLTVVDEGNRRRVTVTHPDAMNRPTFIVNRK